MKGALKGAARHAGGLLIYSVTASIGGFAFEQGRKLGARYAPEDIPEAVARIGLMPLTGELYKRYKKLRALRTAVAEAQQQAETQRERAEQLWKVAADAQARRSQGGGGSPDYSQGTGRRDQIV
jgi:hypothetical protein